MASLAEVIPQFLSPDNGARQAAEQQLAQHRANPSVFMPELLQLARTFPEPHLRQTAAVLLRKSLDASVWPAIGAPGQTSIKAGLLEGVVAETQDPKTRRALADTISKLAGIASASGGWADLLPFVFKLAIDTDGANKKLGFEILASLSIEVGGDAIVPLLEPLQPVLGGALCAPNALAVRVACLNAVESMVEHVKDKEHRAHQQALQAHLPACLAVLQEALASGDMTHAKECLTSFIAIAESDASFLRPHVDSMLSVAFGVAGADLDENVRHLGLELMITFAEAKPGIARKVPNFVETLVPAMCAMIEDIADDDEWDENIGDEDEKDDMCIPENVRCGEEAMLRLFGAIGGNRSVPASLPIISVSSINICKTSHFFCVIALLRLYDALAGQDGVCKVAAALRRAARSGPAGVNLGEGPQGAPDKHRVHCGSHAERRQAAGCACSSFCGCGLVLLFRA